MSHAIALLKSFVKANRAISRRIGKWIYGTKPSLFRQYSQIIGSHLNAQPDSNVVDIGAGKHSPFIEFVDDPTRHNVIGVDISDAEMRRNTTLNEQIVADAEAGIPLESEYTDLVVSRSTLEHFHNTQPVVQEMFRILKPGGSVILLFPSRFSPFSILNRIIPRKRTNKLLSLLVPGSEGLLGFPAYYDHCSPREMRALCESVGFRIADMRVSYRQSSYFGFFVPLYLTIVLYETIGEKLGMDQLAATVLVIARKPMSLTTDC